MSQSTPRDWQVPPAAADVDKKLGWINEGCEEGNWWHKSQRGSTDYPKALEIFSGRVSPIDVPTYRSQLTTGRLKRNTREVVGACANVRPIWGFTSNNDAFQANCNMMNKVSRAIYLERFLDFGLKGAMQWAALTATGWLRPVYHRDMCGWGKGNLTFYTYGAPSYVPVQMPSNNNWQEAYAVHILDEMPVYMAHGMFPKFQEQLTPTKSKFWYSGEIRQASQGNAIQRIWGSGRRGGEFNVLSDLYCPIRYTYVIDLTINETGNMIPMGQIGSPWYYEVPSVGQPKPDKSIATENDARLYPYRRLMISSEKCIMYDGPSFDWHGELPGIQFCLDDWVWEPLGFSLIRDGYGVEKARDEIVRGTMDKVRARLDLALKYNLNAVSKDEAERFDPMQPRARIGYDGDATSDPLTPAVPPEVLAIDPMSIEFLKVLDDVQDHQMAIRDVVELAKLRASGGGMDPDKIAAADGPIVRDISRNAERSIAQTGNQCKYIILEYYDVRRVMAYVGSDAMSMEMFDYDPTTLVPSHLPQEVPGLHKQSPTQNNLLSRASRKVKSWFAQNNGDNGNNPGDNPFSGLPQSAYSKVERARWFADNLSTYIIPHSAHELTQMANKLGVIQQKKAGVLIDSRTIAEAWGQDYGTKPEGNTVWERYWDEQAAIMEHALKMKREAQAIEAAGVSPTPAIQQAAAALSGQQPVEGRPNTGQESPQMVQKDGGTRTTVSESGTGGG